MQFVIPGLTRNPVFSWIPAFAGMTSFVVINVAVYKLGKAKGEKLYALCPMLLINRPALYRSPKPILFCFRFDKS